MPMMIKKKRFFFSVLLLLAAFVMPGVVPAQDEGFVVVVHALNPADSLEAKVVGKIFLKKVKRWPDSEQSVVPVDQGEKSEVREDFTQIVHGKRVSAIKSYWQRMIFSGRDVPPDELSSDAAVLAFVAANPGGVGYVTAGSSLSDGVKVLTLTE